MALRARSSAIRAKL